MSDLLEDALAPTLGIEGLLPEPAGTEGAPMTLITVHHVPAADALSLATLPPFEPTMISVPDFVSDLDRAVVGASLPTRAPRPTIVPIAVPAPRSARDHVSLPEGAR